MVNEVGSLKSLALEMKVWKSSEAVQNRTASCSYKQALVYLLVGEYHGKNKKIIYSNNQILLASA